MTTADIIPGHIFACYFAKQSAAGTPATTYDFSVPLYGGLPRPMQDIQDFEVADGDPFRPGRYKQRMWGEGSIEFGAFPDSAARLINAHLGADAKTGSADPWTHTLTRSTPQWMTFWVRRTLVDGSFKYDRYDDCIVKVIEISAGAGRPLKLMADILAVNVTTFVSAPSATASPLGVTNVLDEDDPWYSWVGTTLKVNFTGTPATAAVHNFEDWTFHMGYDDAELVWTDSLAASFRDIGQWKLGITGSFILQDYNLWNSVFFGATAPSANTAMDQSIPQGAIDFTIPIQSGATLPGGIVANDRTMNIVANYMNFTMDSPEVDVSGKGLRGSLTSTLTKPASGEPVTIKIKNALSADLDA